MRSTSLFLYAVLLGGCVGNIESADERKHVYELTTNELRFLCSWLDDAIETDAAATDEEMCELEAAQASEDANECYQIRSDCIDSSSENERYVAGQACTKKAKVPPRACTATVAQVKACFIAREQELIDAARAASCGDVRGSRLPGSTLVSCRNVFPACQSLFGTLGTSALPITMAPSTP